MKNEDWQKKIEKLFEQDHCIFKRMQGLIKMLSNPHTDNHRGAAILASMQKTSCVLLHASLRSSILIPAIFVDTGAHFQQTLDLVQYYGGWIEFRIVHPLRTMEQQVADFDGRILHLYDEQESIEPGYQTCCALRKRDPFLRASQDFSFIINGLNKGRGKNTTNPTHVDVQAGIIRVHPLYDWTDEELEAHIAENQVRVSALYPMGFTSIGCMTCTTPTCPGESKRAGRWRHLPASAGGTCGINSGEGFVPDI